MIPSRRARWNIDSRRPEYSGGWRSIHRMPSAATSGGSQSDRSTPGVFAMNPSEATGTSIRKQLTATPTGASWRATSTVRRSNATFDIPYDISPLCGYSAATELTLITAPCVASRWGRAVRIATNGACRLIAITSSWRCIGMSRSPTNVTAALLTSTSSRPKCSTVRSTIATTASASERSVGTASASPPRAAIRATVSSRVPGVRCGDSPVGSRCDGDPTPGLGERYGDRGAHAPAGPGDQRDLAVQLHVPGSICWRSIETSGEEIGAVVGRELGQQRGPILGR